MAVARTVFPHSTGRIESSSVALVRRHLLEPVAADSLFGGPMKHHLFTAAILIAALVLYGGGMTSGASVLFVAGAACELWFWVRIRGRRTGA